MINCVWVMSGNVRFQKPQKSVTSKDWLVTLMRWCIENNWASYSPLSSSMIDLAISASWNPITEFISDSFDAFDVKLVTMGGKEPSLDCCSALGNIDEFNKIVQRNFLEIFLISEKNLNDRSILILIDWTNLSHLYLWCL